MTEQDKQLLLKDLCARLPYGVKLEFSKEDKGSHLTIISFNIRTGSLETEENDNSNYCSFIRHIYQSYCYKPYLRPMSSMTEEESNELEKFHTKIQIGFDDADLFDSVGYIDWLNAHHFDYRRLIEKGLALEAPEGMYK